MAGEMTTQRWRCDISNLFSALFSSLCLVFQTHYYLRFNFIDRIHLRRQDETGNKSQPLLIIC